MFLCFKEVVQIHQNYQTTSKLIDNFVSCEVKLLFVKGGLVALEKMESVFIWKELSDKVS